VVYRLIRAFLLILGLGIGYEISFLLFKLNDIFNVVSINLNAKIAVYIIISASFGVLFLLISPKMIEAGEKAKVFIENKLKKTPMRDLIYGFFGLLMGLIIANLFLRAFLSIPWIGSYLPIIANILLGYLGASIAINKKEELSNLVPFSYISPKKNQAPTIVNWIKPKILDTSVIIDGRIADICQTGFIEGPVIIPRFVLEELRHIADSSDVLKRNRGRRGLDILNKMQKELNIDIEIYEGDFEDLAEVDSKLVRLAQLLDGKIITNDFNLNKVAELHKVPVLNINELANAVKPVVLPGEEMVVQVIKDGKESGQGVAYLDDGTMIVVDGGKKHIGETIGVIVTSVLQTAAGRMIFAKPKSM